MRCNISFEKQLANIFHKIKIYNFKKAELLILQYFVIKKL